MATNLQFWLLKWVVHDKSSTVAARPRLLDLKYSAIPRHHAHPLPLRLLLLSFGSTDTDSSASYTKRGARCVYQQRYFSANMHIEAAEHLEVDPDALSASRIAASYAFEDQVN